MPDYRVGDVVARKSYGADISFMVSKVVKNENRKDVYELRGLVYRLLADADVDDIVRVNPSEVNRNIQRNLSTFTNQTLMSRFFNFPFSLGRFTRRAGKILHIDASQQFLDSSMMYYRSIGLRPVGIFVDEPDQPQNVRGLLEKYRPDIVVLTGHDGIRKDATDMNSFASYKNSSYYAKAVREARAYEPNPDKLFIFAGACQSYYEALMSAGANFASSPGRVLVHSLDPVMACQRVATTDSRKIITPQEAVRGTVSGAKGIGGVNARGRLTWV